jgi:hypothetical protein
MTTVRDPKATAPVIHPSAIFTVEGARGALGLAKGCLPREIRLGRLRCSKRAGRYYILGAWLLEWVEAGEVCRRGQAVREDDPNGQP